METKAAIKGFAIALTLIGVALAGCSHTETPITESVPADSRLIVCVNADKLFKEAGCKVKGGIVKLTPELTALKDKLSADNRQIADAIITSAPMIDLSRMIICADDSGGIVVTADLRLPDKFVERLAGKVMRHDDIEGNFVVELDRCVIAIDDNRIRIADNMASLRRFLEALSRNPLDGSSVRGSQLVLGKRLATSTLRLDKPAENSLMAAIGAHLPDNSTAICQIEVSNYRFEATATIVNEKTGEPAELSELLMPVDPSSTDIFDYGDEVFMAVGQPASPADAASLARKVRGKWLESLPAFIVPYVKTIRGTTAVSGAFAGESIEELSNPGSWELTLTTRLQPEALDQAITLLDEMPCHSYNDEGQDVCRLMGRETAYGDFGGQLTLANRTIVFQTSDTDAIDPDNTLAIFIARVPYNSPLMRTLRLRNGLEAACELSSSQLRFRLHFTGDPQPPLSTVVRLLNL